MGSTVLGTRRYNFQPPTATLSAIMHSVTDRQTDRQTTVLCQEPILLHAVVRSAKKAKCSLMLKQAYYCYRAGTDNGLSSQSAGNSDYLNHQRYLAPIPILDPVC